MKRPNLLFVFADQMRSMSLGYLNQDRVHTPCLDRFAAQSLRLTQACSSNPVCGPYRGCLLTGKYSIGSQVLSNPAPERVPLGNCYLPENAICFSDILKEAGYAMGYIGKWHLERDTGENQFTINKGPRFGDVEDTYTAPGPARHGFDFWHAYGCCNIHMHPHYWVNDAPMEAPLEVDKWSPTHESDIAIEFIENAGGKQRDADKPFGLFVSYNPPHHPYDFLPDALATKYADVPSEALLCRENARYSEHHRAWRSVRNYHAMVEGVDAEFGRILDCLSAQGLAEDTIVIFTSDHGEMMGSHGLMHKNVGYEESFLVPFLVRWPGQIAPGEDELLLNTPDIFPTLLSLLGETDRIPEDVEGCDLAAALLGQSREGLPEFQPYYATSHTQPEGGRRGLRTERYTYVESSNPDEAPVVLHDNQEDPYQSRNAAVDHPELCRSLHEQLNAWLRKTQDPWVNVATDYQIPADSQERLDAWLRNRSDSWTTTPKTS